jgi:RsiW-degrading membrane proteinase PrsW (M82 family)
MAESLLSPLGAVCFLIAVVPVGAFLAGLVGLDSYELVPLRAVLGLLVAGTVVALACLLVNPWLREALGLDPRPFARFVAPVVEEALKAAVVVWALATRRVGFLVDAAIVGFAVGAGFAAIENTHYFLVLGEPRPGTWLVRGFGTAVMHGGATSLFGVVSKHFGDVWRSRGPWGFLPGFLFASGVHSLYNSFLVAPDLSAVLLLVGLPPLFFLVYSVSERATERWLGTGFDSDQELLLRIQRGEIGSSPLGRYLAELRRHFPATVVADMLCYLRLHAELSIKAKGSLLLRKAGFDPPPDPTVKERFAELEYLERAIGPTGLLALKPLRPVSRRDLWERHMLGAVR